MTFPMLRPAALQIFWNQGVYIRKEFNSPGFVQSLEFLKKSRNLQSNFPDLEKVWKIEIKSRKMVKSLP